MAVSDVSICNRAIQKLGSSARISALSESSANARSMNAAFEPVRRALLRKYTWSFAIARESIAADGDGPLWGDWNRYSLPNDFLRLLRDDESGVRTDWKIEGQYIVTADESPLEIRYIRDVTDPTEFDTMFVEVFSTALAIATCKEITDSTAMKESLKDDMKTEIADAKKIGAIEKGPQEDEEDTFILAMR